MQFAVISSTSDANAATMDVFRDHDLATATWN